MLCHLCFKAIANRNAGGFLDFIEGAVLERMKIKKSKRSDPLPNISNEKGNQILDLLTKLLQRKEETTVAKEQDGITNKRRRKVQDIEETKDVVSIASSKSKSIKKK